VLWSGCGTSHVRHRETQKVNDTHRPAPRNPESALRDRACRTAVSRQNPLAVAEFGPPYRERDLNRDRVLSPSLGYWPTRKRATACS
jgi:hypothetical protein